MIYRLDKNNYNGDDICKYDLYFKGNSVMHEYDNELRGNKGKNKIIINLLFNGIKGGAKHGPRIKVMHVDGDGGNEYTYPLNPNNGEITYRKEYNPNPKIGEKVAKIVAGFARENYDIISKYYGYRDRGGRIIEGDKSIESKLDDAVNNYNSLSDEDRKRYIRKGIIKYGKN